MKMKSIPQSICTNLTDEQASAAQGGLFVLVDKLQAIKAGADSGPFFPNDDTYLTIDGDKVFGPKGFSTGTTRTVNAGGDYGSSARIELFDDDNFLRGKDDPLGGFTVSSSTGGKQIRRRVSGSGSTYDVYYRAFG